MTPPDGTQELVAAWRDGPVCEQGWLETGPLHERPQLRPPASWPVVRRGDHARDVRVVQLLLDAHRRRLRVDGIYGPGGRDDPGVAGHLRTNGVVRASTWERLIVRVRGHERGDAVLAAQRLLRGQGHYDGQLDGIFGPRRPSARSARFQRGPGLHDDGIAGGDSRDGVCPPSDVQAATMPDQSAAAGAEEVHGRSRRHRLRRLADSGRAIRVAAAALDAESAVVVNVWHDSAVLAGPVPVVDGAAAAMVERVGELERIALEVASEGAAVPEACGATSHGQVGHALVGLADERNAGLVVVGRSGGSLVREAVLGSASGGAVRDGRCPVLVVPHQRRDS